MQHEPGERQKTRRSVRQPRVRDAIIIGARCAGAATAMLLARRGYDVLLVDRDTFPSDIAHGHFIHRLGPQRLQRWGLLDRVLGTGCPPVTKWTLDLGDFPLVGDGLVIDDAPFGIGPRRKALDQILLEAAIEAGVEVREGFLFEEPVAEDGRVVGIRGRAKDGSTTLSEFATVTIGADGRNSRLARSVRAASAEAVPSLTKWVFSYWSGVPGDGLEVIVRGQSVVFAFPTNDGLFTTFAAWSNDAPPTGEGNPERQFMAVLERVPDLADRLKAGRREEPYRGAVNVPNFLRQAVGPGWALVGDAGCHKDPFMALGICDALRDAELLAQSLDAGLSGCSPLDEALAAYERQRNEATLQDYRRNIQSARFEGIPPELASLRASVRDDRAASAAFLLRLQGASPAQVAN